MKFQRIIAATDIEALVAFLESDFDILLELLKNPPMEKPEEYQLDPECLYVFAYKRPNEKMLKFMAANAGKAPNFLAFFVRPGSGFNSTNADKELGRITLLSQESIYTKAVVEIQKITQNSEAV